MVADIAAALGGQQQVRQDAPGFQRLVLTRAGEGLVIDLVKDVGPQLHADKVERGHIVDVLRQVNGNRMAAAKMLGISRRALYRRLERHQIVDIS